MLLLQRNSTLVYPCIKSCTGCNYLIPALLFCTMFCQINIVHGIVCYLLLPSEVKKCFWVLVGKKIHLIDFNYLTTTLIWISWGCSFRHCDFGIWMKWCNRNIMIIIIVRNIITDNLIIHFSCLLQHLFHLLPLCFLDASLQFSFFLSLAFLFLWCLLPVFSLFSLFLFFKWFIGYSFCFFAALLKKTAQACCAHRRGRLAPPWMLIQNWNLKEELTLPVNSHQDTKNGAS